MMLPKTKVCKVCLVVATAGDSNARSVAAQSQKVWRDVTLYKQQCVYIKINQI